MKTNAAWKISKVILACAVLAGIALPFISGESILCSLRKRREEADSDIRERLAHKHGLVFLADFDDASPRDAVSGKQLVFWDVRRVKGRFGSARKIDLDDRPFIQIPATRLMFATDQATFAAWFKPRDLQRRQVLFSQGGRKSSFQLALSQGMLDLAVSDAATNLSASCRFTGAKGRFTHVALVVDGRGAAVFQDGRESVRLALASPAIISAAPPEYLVDSHHPFEGAIDDLAVWKLALPARELKSIASSSRGVLRKCEPWLSFKAKTIGAAESFAAGIFRAVGRLAPPLRNPAVIAKGIPEITLWPTDNDSRHFIKAHEDSLSSGYRTSKAADFRPMNVSFGGRMVNAEVSLDDAYGRSDAKRMAFIVRDPTRTMFGGSGIVRLYPPELHDAIHIDAPRPLPLSGSFLRLFSKDSFKGLYVMESLDRTGSAWMARGERGMSVKKMPYYRSLPAPCDIPPAGVDPEDAFDAAASLVLSDVFFPWSRQEIQARNKAHAKRRAEARFDPVPEDDGVLRHILADNPSAMYVTNDLALDLPGVSWESSDPGLVSPDGSVNRPENGAPRPVTLTPIHSDGTCGALRRIRVIPVSSSIQTLFLHMGFPIQKHRRSDFTCLRIPAGGGAPEWLSGLAGHGGGVKHRGNTSYAKGAKRSMSLEFDGYVDWPDTGRKTRHALLQCGYADPTRLRNKISFDSFRLAAEDGVPCGAVGVSWCEVFVNGEYFGVWETSARVQDTCDPGTDLYKVRSFKVRLWNTTSTAMTEFIGKHDPRSYPYGPLEELFEFTARSPKAIFAAQAGDVFYLDSIVDYYLLLLFTENFDGQATNQFIARSKGEKKWFLVPWDYDKTFADPSNLGLSNNLVNRMVAYVPGFRERLSAKWKRLRAGPMSDEAVLGRIDADSAMLAPYMEEEFMLLRPAGWDGDYAAAVERLRNIVAGRLKNMDRRFIPVQNGE